MSKLYRKAAEDLIAAWYRDPELVAEAAQAMGVTALEAAEALGRFVECHETSRNIDPLNLSVLLDES